MQPPRIRRGKAIGPYRNRLAGPRNEAFQIRLTVEEMNQIKAAAGPMPMATWVRGILLAASEPYNVRRRR